MGILSVFLRSLWGKQQDSRAKDEVALFTESELQAKAEALTLQGLRYFNQGQLDQAAECYLDAIQLFPLCIEALVNIGNVYLLQGRYEEADFFLTKAIALRPELYQPYLVRIQLLLRQEAFEEAIAFGYEIIRLHPTCAEAYLHLGNVCMLQGQYEEAERLMTHAITLEPKLYKAYIVQLQLLLRKGELDRAVEFGQKAISLYPSGDEAYATLGDIYKEQKRYEEAELALAKALELAPERPWSHIIHFHLLLLRGDFERGWAALLKSEKSFQGLLGDQAAEYSKKQFTHERYMQDPDFHQKTILFWTDWGLGDSLLFLRYLTLFRKRYQPQRIIVACEKPLMRIFQDIADEVIPKPQATLITESPYDYHSSLFNLPGLFETQLESIPQIVPYISVSGEDKAKWADRIAALPGLKVGLAWGGGDAINVKDALRSISLSKFEPLLNIEGITWVSLQKGKPAEQLRAMPCSIIDWTEELQDMMDTAALVENLDLTISVDTSVINLVGALGRPGWVLNRYGSEWRWLCDREVSPWYPSVRIFSQPSMNDWDSVIARMVTELQKVVESAGVKHSFRKQVTPMNDLQIYG